MKTPILSQVASISMDKVRGDFPILEKGNGGKPFIYLDTACTALKPKPVVEAMVEYYSEYTSCAGRSIHKFATITTDRFERARQKVAKFINARHPEEIIWTKNTTEAINLVAHAIELKKGDKVLTTNLEHSSGLIPWQIRTREDDAVLDFVLCDKEGNLNIKDFEDKIDRKTKLVSVIHASNVTGTWAPLKEITKIAHDNDAVVLTDAAQSVPHQRIDVRDLGVDFLAFSGHKMCGPTGIGCLYGRYDLLKQLNPFIIGGETIKDADLLSHVLEDVPRRFEGGIQNYAGAIGIGAAVDYLSSLGMESIERYERELSMLLIDGLLEIPNLDLLGPKDHNLRGALASFTMKGIEPHDVAILLDKQNIFVRSGMHCAYPAHKFLAKEKGSVRASLYFYNTAREVTEFLDKLRDIATAFA